MILWHSWQPWTASACLLIWKQLCHSFIIHIHYAYVCIHYKALIVSTQWPHITSILPSLTLTISHETASVFVRISVMFSHISVIHSTNQYCHQLYHLSLCSPNSVEMKDGAVADADLAGCHVADWPMSLNCFQLFQAPVQLRQCTRCKLIKLLFWYTYITHTMWNNTRQLHKPEIICPVNRNLESKHYRTASSEWLVFSKHLTDVSTYLPVTISNYMTILSNTHTQKLITMTARSQD